MPIELKYARVIRSPSSRAPGLADLLPHKVTDALADGRLLRAAVDQPLPVTITTDASIALPTYYMLWWDEHKIAASKRELDESEAVPGTEITLYLPVEEMAAEGLHHLDYAIYTGWGENEQRAHYPLALVVDRTPPGEGGLGALNFTSVPDDVLLEEHLSNDQLIASVPSWLGEESGDVVTGWIAPGSRPAPGDWIELAHVTHTVTRKGEAVSLAYDKADLTALDDGEQSFSYKVRDALGNPSSALANAKLLRVLLTTQPRDIKPPVIPAFDDHGLITWDDARPGVQVEIPLYTNVHPKDQIVVHWGGQTLLPTPWVGLPPDQDPLITVVVPVSTVLAAGNGQVDVRYDVQRGPLTLGHSQPTPVLVNLDTPGGIVDPQPETPEHDNLQAAVVHSADGDINHIPAQAYKRDGTITIAHLGVNGDPVWQAGDDISIRWGDLLLTTQTLDGTQTSADLVVPLSSAEVIQKGPKGVVEVQYSIARKLDSHMPPNTGVALSPLTEVLVVSSDDIPGGGQPLPVPVFTEANANNVINQAAGIDGTPVRITLPIDNLEPDAGHTLSLRFSGVFSFSDKNAPEIPGTQVENNHVLTQADVDNGYFDFHISAATLRTICEYGAVASYTATNPTGSVPSAKALVIVSVRTPAYCEVPTP